MLQWGRILMRGSCIYMGSCLVVTAILATTAAAQSPDNENDRLAREHFELGKALYSAGQYSQAIGEFEIAYRLSKRPPLLYNIYLAARNAGRRPTAADALRRYLRLAPNASNRDALELQLRALDESLRNYPPDLKSRDPDSTPLAVPPQPTPERQTPPLLGVAVTGLGAAMLIGGTVTGFMAISQNAELQDQCPDNVCLPGFESDVNRLETLTTLTDVLLIGGAGVLALGIGLWLWLDNDTDEAEAMPVTTTASCTWDGCIAQARVRY